MSSEPKSSLDNDRYDAEDSLLEQRSDSDGSMQLLRKKSFFARHGRYLLIQLGLIALYTFIFVLASRASLLETNVPRDRVVYSPAQSALRYERVRFNATLVIDSPYNGPPSPEVDAAWRNLLENMNIAVPGADLDRIGASSIKLPNTEDAYIAGLSVYHELHCLKRLRQFTWPEYYYPNLRAEENRLNRLHADHCIDILRQAILCHSDTSLFTLQWSAAEPMPRADFSHEHTCVDWQTLFAWADERKIDEEAMKSLQHPLHGAAFPEGEGSRLGASEDHSQTVHGA